MSDIVVGDSLGASFWDVAEEIKLVNSSIKKEEPLEDLSSNCIGSGSLFDNCRCQMQPMGSYVGQLKERWQFPSDHLPIGITLNGISYASWNVLDNAHMSWVIEKDSQGLKDSMISQEHVYLEGFTITVRDQHVIHLVLEMLSHPTYPKSVISLQECGKDFSKELSRQLPSNYQIISSQDRAVIVNTDIFEIESIDTVYSIYSQEPQRSLQDIILKRKDASEKIRLINAHLPGGPMQPSRFEFGEYLKKVQASEETVLAMGDMNFNELEMQEVLQNTYLGKKPPFEIYSPYCTNISPVAFTSKAIDHFFLYTPDEQSEVQISAPEEVLVGLEPICELLTPKA